MTRYHVGTSGWLYDHWRGVFYPERMPHKVWLGHYVHEFDTVELNNSFYRLPSERSWDAWREAAPPGFAFAVKASRYLTHFKRFKDPEDSLRRLFEGAERLGDRLGPLLYEAPPDFEPTKENVARLEAFLALLPPKHQHAVEFRAKAWYGDETLELLRRHGVAFCCHDMRRIETPLAVTARHVYLRFHGTTESHGGSYTTGMLEDWAAKLRTMPSEVEDVWLYFNNDADGHAPANARTLRDLLAKDDEASG